MRRGLAGGREAVYTQGFSRGQGGCIYAGV